MVFEFQVHRGVRALVHDFECQHLVLGRQVLLVDPGQAGLEPDLDVGLVGALDDDGAADLADDQGLDAGGRRQRGRAGHRPSGLAPLEVRLGELEHPADRKALGLGRGGRGGDLVHAHAEDDEDHQQ